MFVVLTLGRSGSSLLMQSLRLLGAIPLGMKFQEGRGQEHFAGNPNGYFEDPAIFEAGPGAPLFRDALEGESVGPQACKMDLHHLGDPDQFEHWLSAEPQLPAIYISIRNPVEQAHSDWVGYEESGEKDRRSRFEFVTMFFREYRSAIQSAAQALDGPLAELKGRAHLVDYSESQKPENFVRRIASTSGLATDEAQIQSAIDNIQPGLYRHRAGDISQDQHKWAQSLGVVAFYEKLGEAGKEWATISSS